MLKARWTTIVGWMGFLSLMLAPAASLAAEVAVSVSSQPTSRPSILQQNLRRHVEYLASEDLEGREVGRPGSEKAALYVTRCFQEAGLRPPANWRDYSMAFTVSMADGVNRATTLQVGDTRYHVGVDFVPRSISAEKPFSGTVVFAGYGLSPGTASATQPQDEHAGLEVKGKVVLLLRADLRKPSGGAAPPDQFRRQVETAVGHGAVAVLMVTPPSAGADALTQLPPATASTPAAVPVLHIRRPVAEQMLKLGHAPELRQLEEQLAQGRLASMDLKDVTVTGAVIRRRNVDIQNIVGSLPGVGPKADEVIVVGAHYDHLGRANRSQIYPGADDNASGTAAMLELARFFAAAGPQPRTLLFVGFGGEEWGMLGSAHFVQHPPVPRERIVAMVNLDMVGRLRLGTVAVSGVGTAREFAPILTRATQRSPLFMLRLSSANSAASDQAPFAEAGIPALFFCTGPHADMHQVSDVPESINYAGQAQIVELVHDVIRELAQAPRPRFVSATQPTTRSSSPGLLGTLKRMVGN